MGHRLPSSESNNFYILMLLAVELLLQVIIGRSFDMNFYFRLGPTFVEMYKENHVFEATKGATLIMVSKRLVPLLIIIVFLSLLPEISGC